MNQVPLRMRLTLAFAPAMAFVLVGVGLLLYVRLGRSLDEQIGDRLASRSDGIVTLLRTTPLDELQLPPEEDGFALVVSGTEGLATDPEARALVLISAERARARREPLLIERDVSGSDGETYRARLLVRYTQAGSLLVVTGESLEDREEALDGLLAQLLVVGPLALALTSIAGYLLAGAALRPVESLRRGAEEISIERTDRRLPVPSANDEVRRLGETLNEMLGRLDEGIARERRFVADASHELRTPLAALRTELELATRRPRAHHELEAALSSAREEVERLVRLAEDLLVLARADEGRLALRIEDGEAAAVLDAVRRRSAQRARAAGRRLEVLVPGDVALIADRQRIEQALDILVDNALRHGKGAVVLSAHRENGRVVLAVSDEGAGFPADFLPHAFERFSRADPARTAGGAGLGLAIVDAIARAHGGVAEAANVGGGGAEVRLALPSRLNDGDAARGDRRDVG